MQPRKQTTDSIPPSETNIPNQEPSAPTQASDPGQAFGIISLVAPFVQMGIIGIIFGILGKKKSKAAGFKNSMATAGIVLSVVQTIIGTAYFGFFIYGAVDTYRNCEKLGGGTHAVNNVVYECDSTLFGDDKTKDTNENTEHRDSSFEL